MMLMCTQFAIFLDCTLLCRFLLLRQYYYANLKIVLVKRNVSNVTPNHSNRSGFSSCTVSYVFLLPSDYK